MNNDVSISEIRLLTLDPATHYTGYAYFESRGDSHMDLVQYGLMKATKKEEFDIRSLEIASKVRNFIIKQQCTEFALEFPEFQSGSRGAHAARQGDTLKLAFLCGSLVTGWQLHVAQVMAKTRNEVMLPMAVILRPSQWKGQLPKQVSAARCRNTYNVHATKELEYNYSDAIMIGDYLFKQREWGAGGFAPFRVDF